MSLVVTRRFDGGEAYATTFNWPPVNMTREDKRASVAAIELSDFGTQQSLTWLIELWHLGGLQNSFLYRAPETPRLKPQDAKANHRYREEPIGKRHCREAMSAHHIGRGLATLADTA